MKLQFDLNQSVPKYRQIIDAVQLRIKEGSLKKGDRIPSLNKLCKEYNLSQDTVLMAYNELKAKGIITSQVGKGYYIQNEQVNIGHKVLLLFDKLTAYKEKLYESFKSQMGNKGSEQIFFHHNNIRIFKTILENAAGEFSDYVIMPMHGKEAEEIIASLPANKVLILDQGRKSYRKKYSCVCQDFERDIYRMLKTHQESVIKYKRLILAANTTRQPLREIARGFRDFCRQAALDFEIIPDAKNFDIRSRDLFIVVSDRDLECLVRWSLENDKTLGQELGIISYNETPLKGIVSTGITTISTDFAEMGKTAAGIIMENKKSKIDNPFVINRRSSF